MRTKIPEESKLNRRRFLGAAAMTVAAAQSGVFSSVGAQAGTAALAGGAVAGKPNTTTVVCPTQAD